MRRGMTAASELPSPMLLGFTLFDIDSFFSCKFVFYICRKISVLI